MNILDTLADVIGTAQDQLWTWLMAPLVVLVGLYLTVRSGFVQFRWIPEMFRTVTDRSPLDDEGRPQSTSAF